MWAPDKVIVLWDAPVILLRNLTYRFREIIWQTEGCPAGDTPAARDRVKVAVPQEEWVTAPWRAGPVGEPEGVVTAP